MEENLSVLWVEERLPFLMAIDLNTHWRKGRHVLFTTVSQRLAQHLVHRCSVGTYRMDKIMTASLPLGLCPRMPFHALGFLPLHRDCYILP